MVSFYLLTTLDKIVANAHRFRCLSLNISDEQVWRRRMNFFLLTFPLYEFFLCQCMNIF